MIFKKYNAKAEVETTSTTITPKDVTVFTCPENSSIIVLTLEMTSKDNTVVYIKQCNTDKTVMFQTKLDIEENDYVGFTHKLIFTEGQSLVIAADSDTFTIQAHCAII